ncbi:zinc finger protein [Salix suchowensis]|nr:zinc finger protein [Salix suchowensis]
MPGLTCNSCNKEFDDDAEQKLHYKSEWHRYNLKRKVAGVPGVTEALFVARQSAIDKEKEKNETPMLYSCVICNKGYRTSQLTNQEEENTVIKPLPRREVNKRVVQREADVRESEDSEDEWEEVDSDEELVLRPQTSLDDIVEDDEDDMLLDPSCCFICMVHMHKHHGFFIPDVEYLKDPQGLLTYLGLKVKRDFLCLYCNDSRQPFNSLEAVRKHMEAKSHCKVHYGDGDEDEEAELEDFYDYSSSYVAEDGRQLVASGDMANTAELGSGGSELIITTKSGSKVSSKTLGSREYLRYYRQKPRPSPANHEAIMAALASRYRSMGLATVQSREQMVRMKVMKQVSRSAEAMRTKISMKNNVIWNLPKNVPY